MAQPVSWIPHVEAFVDSSVSPEKQMTSIDAIAELLKNDMLGILELVKEMDMYLTTTDHYLRARGMLLLGEILTRLAPKPLDGVTIHCLMEFFSARLSDWQALRGSLVGSLALFRRRKNVGMVLVSDAKELVCSFLRNVQVQSLALHDRKVCFELLECFLDCYADAALPMADDLVDGISEAIDGEKDPRCLMIIFHIIELYFKLLPDPSGPLPSVAEELFELLSCYFPIYFTHPKNENIDVTRDDLSRALMLAFGSTPHFEAHVIPLLLEKLASSLPLAKLDSLKYLSYCALHYGVGRMRRHGKSIWSSLKYILLACSEKKLLIPLLEEREALQDDDEIEREAVLCLGKMIFLLDDPEDHMFVNYFLEDEDMKEIFKSVVNENKHSAMLADSKQKLCAFASILTVFAKVSSACCLRVLQSFFIPLLDVLGISSSSCFRDEDNLTKQANFGALYLCVEVLASCRDLAASLAEVCEETDNWVCLLRSIFSPLVGAFESLLLGEDLCIEEVSTYVGLKGLKILSLFPRSVLLTSKETMENILMIFVSVITSRFQQRVLWKLALKSLVEIGAFAEKSCDSDMELSFMTVVDKINLSLLHEYEIMPFPLKLEALSDIGTASIKSMLRVIKGMEEVLHTSIDKASANGDPESSKVLVNLMECYSTRLLPWLQNFSDSEIAVNLAIGLLDHVETLPFKFIFSQDVLDATSLFMKASVYGCSPEIQGLIVQKACQLFSSCTLFKSKEVMELTAFFEIRSSQFTKNMVNLSCRDELIISLLASVIIALHPQTPLAEAGIILKHFVVVLFIKGKPILAQALGSIVNKWSLLTNKSDASSCTLEEALDIILERGILKVLNLSALSDWSSSVQIYALSGLGWVTKGLLMCGHPKVKELVMLIIDFLTDQHVASSKDIVDYSVIRAMADVFSILLSDTDDCLNKKFHATMRPLYKQRLFSSMMPVFLLSIKGCDSSFLRCMLYRAFGHVICGTPLTAILTEARRLVPVLLEILSMLSEDIQNKDLVYSLLLVLSGILIEENAKEAVVDNAHIVIGLLVKLVPYPHMTLVRETTIQCLVASTGLPYSRIYPLRSQVLQATLKALDDHKRIIRQEAVRCRQACGHLGLATWMLKSPVLWCSFSLVSHILVLYLTEVVLLPFLEAYPLVSHILVLYLTEVVLLPFLEEYLLSVHDGNCGSMAHRLFGL